VRDVRTERQYIHALAKSDGHYSMTQLAAADRRQTDPCSEVELRRLATSAAADDRRRPLVFATPAAAAMQVVWSQEFPMPAVLAVAQHHQLLLLLLLGLLLQLLVNEGTAVQ
jgi:hypothetical protein